MQVTPRWSCGLSMASVAVLEISALLLGSFATCPAAAAGSNGARGVATLHALWSAPSQVQSPQALLDRNTVATADEGSIVLRNAFTGAAVWETSALRAPIAVYPGHVIAVSRNNRISSIDVATHRIAWTTSPLGSGAVTVGSARGTIVAGVDPQTSTSAANQFGLTAAIDAKTGKILWKVHGDPAYVGTRSYAILSSFIVASFDLLAEPGYPEVEIFSRDGKLIEAADNATFRGHYRNEIWLCRVPSAEAYEPLLCDRYSETSGKSVGRYTYEPEPTLNSAAYDGQNRTEGNQPVVSVLTGRFVYLKLADRLYRYDRSIAPTQSNFLKTIVEGTLINAIGDTAVILVNREIQLNIPKQRVYSTVRIDVSSLLPKKLPEGWELFNTVHAIHEEARASYYQFGSSLFIVTADGHAFLFSAPCRDPSSVDSGTAIAVVACSYSIAALRRKW